MLQKIDTACLADPQQVIAVPKIFFDRVPQRSALRRPQKAKQWVEVRTMLSSALLQQHTAEHIIDLPVPGRGCGGERGGLQGSHPGQGSTAGASEQIVDNPIRGGPQGFLPRQGMLQRSVEQIAEIPVPAGGGPHLPDPGASRFSAVSHGESLGVGICALLHWMSEVRIPPGVRVRRCTGTRAHGRQRLIWPRSWRTRISSTSSSNMAAAHG